MIAHLDRLPADSFFLKAELGKRFCIYHAPQPGRICRGAFIYVHPFAEETNRSRHVVALQARAFADRGYGVLLIDLFGCGDSSGELADATWTIWKTDLTLAEKWLNDRLHTPIGLWGLRLGALLALDFARDAPCWITPIILWQPVTSGKSFMTQFLRLRAARKILSQGVKTDRAPATPNSMRNALLAGETLEIAGYDITAPLAFAIDALDAKILSILRAPVHWFDISSKSLSTIPPSTTEVVSAWRHQAVDLHLHTVVAPPFWATQELSDAPELLAATAKVLDDFSAPPI